MATYNRSKPWIIRIFSGKNPIIFALMAIAFIALYMYRLNDPIPVGTKIKDFTLTSTNGKSFNISEIKMPMVLVFFKKHNYFSNYMFYYHYYKLLPQLSFLQDNNLAQIIVIADNCDTPEKILSLSKEKNHAILERLGFATDTKEVAKNFGIRSWPHLFVISSNGIILYEAKLASADYIKNILWRN